MQMVFVWNNSSSISDFLIYVGLYVWLTFFFLFFFNILRVPIRFTRNSHVHIVTVIVFTKQKYNQWDFVSKRINEIYEFEDLCRIQDDLWYFFINVGCTRWFGTSYYSINNCVSETCFSFLCRCNGLLKRAKGIKYRMREVILGPLMVRNENVLDFLKLISNHRIGSRIVVYRYLHEHVPKCTQVYIRMGPINSFK